MSMDSTNNLLHALKVTINFLALQGAYAGQYSKGIHYFNVLYRSPTTFSFNDCKYDYKDNKNLYAMMLPPSCKTVLVNPKTTVTIPQSGWTATDLKYSLILSKLSHVIITYQHTGSGPKNDYYFVTRIKINSEAHRVSFCLLNI